MSDQLFDAPPQAEPTRRRSRSRRRKKKNELSPYPLQGDPWCKPWLRGDGRVWVYAGYGEWQALSPDDPRVALRQHVWERTPDIWQRDLNMLTTYLKIQAAQHQRSHHGSR